MKKMAQATAEILAIQYKYLLIELVIIYEGKPCTHLTLSSATFVQAIK